MAAPAQRRASLFALAALLAGCGGAAAPGTPPGPMKVVLGDAPQRGPADAWVTVVEFADLACPFSSAEEAVVREVLAALPADVRLVYKHFPLYPSPHPQARAAAVAAECARVQGPPQGPLFWAMHDLLFERQADLSAPAISADAAGIAGLDRAAWAACTGTQAPLDRVLADQAWGMALGVEQTPTFAINGEKLVGAVAYPAFRARVDAALAWAQASGIARADYYQRAVLEGAADPR